MRPRGFVMTAGWTADRVEALAPDRASVGRARSLAFASRWSGAGRLENLLWGVVGGRGRTPYRVVVDLAKPEVSCSCPSRKRPCKHGLALLFLLTDQPHVVPDGAAPPDWVGEWLAAREARARRREARGEAKADDPETRARRAADAAKREQERERKVRGGIEELALFLRDVVRQGVAAQTEHSYGYWDEMGARLIDAQAPGLARMVRGLAGVPHSGEGWAGRFLERVARIHLLVEAYRRIDGLAPEVADEVRALVGFKQSRDALRAGPGIEDQWWVLGRWVREDPDDAMITQRTWLFGIESKREALLLDFSFSGAPLDQRFSPGACVFTELAFYPGSLPLRALAKRDPEVVTRDPDELVAACDSLRANVDRCGAALARQPWATRFCARVRDVTIAETPKGWIARDANHEVALAGEFEETWTLLALGGGRPTAVLGEWENGVLLPLGAVADEGYVPFVTGRISTW